MTTQTELVYRKDIFWGPLSWNEIYAWGGEDSVLPSWDRDYAKPTLYQNTELLRKTAKVVLGEVEGRIRGLEDKILGYQASEKEKVGRIFSGLIKRRGCVEGCFSSELGGDSDSRISDIPAQMAQGRKYGTDERDDHKEDSLIVELGDQLRYTGLVQVAQGLQRMLNENVFMPEVVGKYFYDTYQKLNEEN